MASSLGSAVGAAGGIGKYFEGRKMQKEAQKFIDSFEWKELKNAYENQQVSTLGADLQREEASRMASTMIDTLRQGGTRAIVGGLGQVEAQNRMMNRQVASDLDQQQKQIDFAKSQDDAVIRGMEEKRQTDELQGYGQMMSTGMGMKYGGISDVVNATMMAGMTTGGQSGVPQAQQGMATPPIQPQGTQQTFQAPQTFNPQQFGNFGGGAMGGGMAGFLQGFSL